METKTNSHFRILKKIDEGGMAKIYLAEDNRLSRKVALKFLRTHFNSNEQLINRFIREARAAAALEHPNIVTVYELSQYKNEFYIVMEYIDGVSLRSLMLRKKISIMKALVIAIQICRGLRKAHTSGILHRDIKPENIMVDKDGWVKILDFGLAQLKEYSRITNDGVRMGTTPYIPPEQLKGEKLQPTADIFSLGVLLYELIARKHPFEGNTEEEIMYSILNKKPEALTRQRPNASAGLKKIVEKTLEKNPKARYQNIDELLSDLKREMRYYAKQTRQKSKGKVRTETLSFKIKVVDSNIFQAGIAKFKTSLMQLSSSKQSPKKKGFKRFAIPFFVLLLFAIPVIASLALEEFRNNLNIAERSRIPSIEDLIQVRETKTLKQKVKQFRQMNLISTGSQIDFSSLDKCYLFVFDTLKVLDIFDVKDNLFRSLKSQKKFTTLPNKLSGKSKIWIQDLTAKKIQTLETPAK